MRYSYTPHFVRRYASLLKSRYNTQKDKYSSGSIDRSYTLHNIPPSSKVSLPSLEPAQGFARARPEGKGCTGGRPRKSTKVGWIGLFQSILLLAWSKFQKSFGGGRQFTEIDVDGPFPLLFHSKSSKSFKIVNSNIGTLYSHFCKFQKIYKKFTIDRKHEFGNWMSGFHLSQKVYKKIAQRS